MVAIAWYFSSTDEHDIVDCFLVFLDIDELPSKLQYLVMKRWEFGQWT